MSDLVASNATANPSPRARSSPARSTGILVALACLVLFAGVATQQVAQSYVAPFSAAYWNARASLFVIGGQWLTVALLDLVQLIPGSTPASASLVTLTTAALLQGWFAATLVRRGWTPLQAALAAGLTAVHPVMLFLAASGSTLLLSVIAAGALVLALDWVEAIGDAQSMIVFGIAGALMFAIWPNALYFGAIALLALPIASREVRSASAALAAFFIACVPTLILIAAFLLGTSLFGVSVANVLAVWQAPLHGAPAALVAASAWLRAYGGMLWQPFFQLMLFCLALTPRVIAILLRLLFRRSERARPVTGLIALFAPSLAGALMTRFWHVGTPLTTVALSMAIAMVWTMTVSLRPHERWLWIATIVVGVVVGWDTPLLWHDPNMLAWRGAVLHMTGG